MMTRHPTLDPLVERPLRAKEPFLWLNEHRRSSQLTSSTTGLSLDHVYEAEGRLRRFAGVLMALFPELVVSDGIIESPLYPAQTLQQVMGGAGKLEGRWFIKGDHALPVAGSVKARGGVYEVLVHAESLALRHGVLHPQDDRLVLTFDAARALFARHRVAVGSTGNLGLSIGVMAAALGFQATVHMSADAKAWKKARLRARGVEVIEHLGDFGAAVAAGRESARLHPNTYFVDDENSQHLFLGYSVAALRLARQLEGHGVVVDAQHPLFVYLPCGVGGAPGGITFGLRHLFGDHVHCFFAEPVASPCMLVRLASRENAPLSVREVGLDNRTEADGLAVGQASEWVAQTIRSMVSGIFTVPDPDLFEDLYVLSEAEGLRIEPSAAAGFRGPRWVLESDPGRQYLSECGLLNRMADATHILWTTGGAFVPDEEYQHFYARGKRIRGVHS